MADAQANINVNLDTSDALAQLKILQRQISSFHQAMAIGGAKARAESAQLSQTLINTVNSSGKFSASIQRTLSTTESFTNALERNKLSMTQYFRFGVGATKNFGRVFRSEFATIDKVARERVKTLQTQYIQLGRDANGAMQSIAVRPLALDMKNLGTQVMMTAQRQQIFNQLLRQGSTNLLNFGKNTQWAGRQLMVGFTIPLSILGATAGREFMKLEEQAVKFRRVYGDMFTTSAETEKALDNIRELADEFTKYGIAVEKTLDLAAKVAQMGNMGDALEAQVTQATRLAVLGGLEQQEALDTTISLTNAFGVATEDLAGKIAFLNAAENQTILAIEDFNEAIPKAGSVVKQLGGDVEDLAFFLTAMREGGINASRGANALKSSLGRLINPTDVAREKLGEFGIDILSIVERNSGNLREMVLELGYELDRLDPLNRARAIEQLFGKFQFARMSTMFQNIVKDGTQARKVLDLTANSTEELAILAERELSRVEDSVSFKFQKQIEKLQAALAPIGGEFIKAVLPLLEGATKILKAFNGMSDGAKQFAVIAVAAIGVIAPTFLMLFGLVANGFANFIKGITKVFGGLGMLAGRSQMVGGSMAYMTQEQLEAQAVSSSLQQTHQTLTQTFTSEVGAVNTLAAAYEAAIQKLQRFNAAAASTAATTGAAAGAGAAGAAGAAGRSRYNPFMPPKKYNKGVVMVPGPKGKGDIIPAMLTPGEAVIPAEETQKYLPLIKGIVNDSLPGYQVGNESELGSATAIARRVSSPSMPASKMPNLEARIQKLVDALGPERVEAAVANLAESITSASQFEKTDVGRQLQKERMMGKEEFLHIEGGQRRTAGELVGQVDDSAGGRMVSQWAAVDPSKEIQLKSAWGRTGSAYANRALPGGLDAKEAMEEFSSTGVEKWTRGIKGGGGDVNSQELVASFESFDQRLTQLQQEAIDEGVEFFTDTEADIARLQAESGADFDASKYRSYESMEAQAAQVLTPEAAAVRQQAIDTTVSARAPLTSAERANLESLAASGDPNAAGLLKTYGQQSKRERKFGAGGVVFDSADVVDSTEMAMPTQDAQEDAQEYSQTLEQALESTSQDPYMYVRDRMSPHEMAGPDGQSDATEYGTEFANALNQQGSNLQPPAPPGDLPLPGAPAAPGAGGTGRQSIRTRIGGFVSSGVEKFSQTKLGQRAGQKLAGMSGVALSDNQGNIVYDPNQDPNTWAGKMEEANQRVSNSVDELAGNLQEADAQIDNYSQSVEQSGDAAQQASQQQDLAPDPRTGEMIPRAQADKIARKENRRQKRQARAGKALVGLGAVTGGLAAATQINVEIPGIGNIGEFAQKLMPVTGALTAIAPILLALPAPLALLVGVIGAGVAAWMIYNKKLKEATKSARDLAEGLGSGSKAMDRFAEFAGTVTASELMRERRQGGVIAKVAGKSEFGEQFVQSDQGKELIQNVEDGLKELGRSDVVDDFTQQLSTAVYSNILTLDQARGIALEVGREIEDLSLSVEVIGEMNQLIGPDGVDILENGLEVGTRLIVASQEDIFGAEGTVEDLVSAIVDPENAESIRGWFSGLFDVPELQAQLGAELLAAEEQRQEILDANQRATEDRINQLREEAAELRNQGKIIEANQKLAEVDDLQLKFEKERAELLQESKKATEEFFGEYNKISGLADTLSFIGGDVDAFLRSETTGGRGGDIQTVVDALKEYEEVTGKDLGIDFDTASVVDITQKYKSLRGEFSEINKIQSGLEGTLGQIGQSIIDRFADTDQADRVKTIIEEISGSEFIEFDVKYNLLTGVGNEVFSIDQVTNFLEKYVTDPSQVTLDQIEAFKEKAGGRAAGLTDQEIRDAIIAENQRVQARFSGLMSSLGQGAGQQLMNIFQNVDGETESKLLQQLEIELEVEGETAAQETIDLLSNLSQYQGNILKGEAIVEFYTKNPEKLEELQEKLNETQDLLDDGQLTVEQVIERSIIEDPQAVSQFKANSDFFDSLPPVQQKLFIQTFLTVMDNITPEDIAAERAAMGPYGSSSSDSVIRAKLGIEQTKSYVENVADLGFGGETEPPEPEPKGGGGSDPSSFLDEIVEKYRNFSDASQELTKGFDASLQAIMDFANGGAWGMNGLARQLRNVNVSETMIEKFLGMDPEEWEKIKPTLFETDESGERITGLTEQGKAVQQAEAGATIAEETENLESQVRTTEDQLDAYDKLIAQGASVALAYEMIQNKNLASAIATRKNANEIRRLIQVQKELKELEEEVEEINEEEQRKERIREAVKNMNKEFEDQVKTLDKVRAATDKYTDAQINAIFGNKDLRSLFLEPNIDKAALEKALDNAEKQAQLELDIKLLTFEGREDYLSEAFKSAKERLSAEENRIEIAFDLEVAGQEKVINEAQNEIDSLTYMIDDYQAQLDEIQYREDAINEKYDKRTEALDKIADINDRIASQQKNQLDLAEALSRGDIAAAAQAAQTAREQESKDNLDAQREMMEQRKQAELESIKSLGGLTRTQIEDQIDTLNRRIANIEETRMEPAEEYIRLAEIRRDTELENLEVLGRTSQQWDLIQNNLDVARTRNYEFMNEMREQFNMYPEVLQKYLAGSPLPAPPALPKPPPVRRSSGGGGRDTLSSKEKRENARAWKSHVAQVRSKKQAPGTFSYPNRIDSKGRRRTGQGSGYAAGGYVARMAMGGYIRGGMFTNMAVGGPVPYRGKGGSSTRMAMGGKVKGYPMGGLIPYKNAGGMFKSLGSDTIPAMLTPGEFVIRRPAVSMYGVDNLEKINRGTYNDGSVYNYNLAVNVRSDSNPDQIANTVMREIKRIDSQRIRNNRY